MICKIKERAALFLGALALVSCATTQSESKAPSTKFDLVIQNVTAIDAVQGARANVDVTIVGGQITSVSAADPAIAHSARQVVDGRGKYLIPGLWDAHVHLAYDPKIGHEVFFPLSLAHGVTYLRDTGGRLDKLAEARAIADSDAIAPDLYVSGPLIDGEKRVYAGQASNFPNISVGVGDAVQAAVQVDALAVQEVDFIKAYEMLSPEAFRAVVERAKYHGLPVTAHSPLSMTAMQAIEAGIKDMQHLRNLEMDCVADPLVLLGERQAAIAADDAEFGGQLRSTLHGLQRGKAIAAQDPDQCAKLIASMRENGVSQTPTLAISRFLSRKLHAEPRWRETFALMPKSVGKGWSERSITFVNREPTEQDRTFDRWLMNMVAELDKAGVSILAGTDAPIAYLTPGASLHEELAMLVEAGLSPLDAIGAATIGPATFLGLEDQLGSVSPGRKADLVLLNENPLTDIRNIAKIHGVLKDGRLLDRSALDSLRDAPSLIE